MYPRIKEIRKERGLTQAEVAQKLGILQRQYSKYESGMQEPSLAKAIKIADALDVSLDYLTERTDIKTFTRKESDQ